VASGFILARSCSSGSVVSGKLNHRIRRTGTNKHDTKLAPYARSEVAEGGVIGDARNRVGYGWDVSVMRIHRKSGLTRLSRCRFDPKSGHFLPPQSARQNAKSAFRGCRKRVPSPPFPRDKIPDVLNVARATFDCGFGISDCGLPIFTCFHNPNSTIRIWMWHVPHLLQRPFCPSDRPDPSHIFPNIEF